MLQKRGIWICTFSEMKSLIPVLREAVLKLYEVSLAQENKGEKMVMLYDYLTGNEFRQQITAIVEGFKEMQSDLDSEKKSMIKIWKKREKQIQKISLNTVSFYGSIQGIAGSALKSIDEMELGVISGSENRLLEE